MHSVFHDIDRANWAPLADDGVPPLTEREIGELAGRDGLLSLDEVQQVYSPLAQLIALRVQAARELRAAQVAFLGLRSAQVPFVIGLAGSVAVGKSTTARVLKALLARNRDWKVTIVPTDGFLFPNKELDRRGIMSRKGFPESYDQRALLDFMHAIKSGVPQIDFPSYSHASYDVLQKPQTLHSPDVIIVEGLTVLQTGTSRTRFVSDYFDFALYVDASISDLQRWYVSRFLQLRDTAFQDPEAYFHRYAGLSKEEATDTALRFWRTINEVNLVQNILPTRTRADLILEKGHDHRICCVRLRKL